MESEFRARLPLWLKRSERHGKFNVGLLSFQNDGVGRACLDEWRGRCLGRCHDGQEAGKYADQKYLDEWPEQVGAALLVLPNAGVNLAPWNWGEIDFVQRRWVDDGELVLFHFANTVVSSFYFHIVLPYSVSISDCVYLSRYII